MLNKLFSSVNYNLFIFISDEITGSKAEQFLLIDKT